MSDLVYLDNLLREAIMAQSSISTSMLELLHSYCYFLYIIVRIPGMGKVGTFCDESESVMIIGVGLYLHAQNIDPFTRKKGIRSCGTT